LEAKSATIEAKGYQKAGELETNKTLMSNLERTSDAKAKSIFLFKKRSFLTIIFIRCDI